MLGKEDGGENYYGIDPLDATPTPGEEVPTMGGLMRYLQEEWLGTVFEDGGGLSWDESGTDEITIHLETSLDLEREIGLNMGEEAENDNKEFFKYSRYAIGEIIFVVLIPPENDNLFS